MELSTRNKRLLRWVGLPVLALVTFVFTLQWTFPYDRLRQKIEDKLGEEYEVSIESIKPSFFPGGVVIHKIFLKTRPKRPNEKPTAIFVDKVEAGIGLLGLIRGRYDVDLVAQIGSGTVDGSVVLSKAGLKADFSTKGLPLESIPGLASAVGLPMEGGLNARLALDLPKRKWREADGVLKVSCPGCTIGDGVAKIKPKPMNGARSSARRRRAMAFAGDGVTVPKLELGDLSGEIDIKAGVGTVKTFAAHSKDGDLTITGEARFEDPFKNSTFPGCMRFKLSEELKRREKNFGNLPDLMRVSVEEDGFANVGMTGKLSELRWRPRKKCAPIGGSRRRGERPTVTARPPRPTPTPHTRPGIVTPEQPATQPGTDGKPTAEPEKPNPDAIGSSGPTLTPGERHHPKRGGDDVKPGEPNGTTAEPPPGLAKRPDNGEAIDDEGGDERDDDGEARDPDDGDPDEMGDEDRPRDDEEYERGEGDEQGEGEPHDDGDGEPREDDAEGDY